MRATLVGPEEWISTGEEGQLDEVTLSITPSAIQTANTAFYTALTAFAAQANSSGLAYSQMTKGSFLWDLAQFTLAATSGDAEGAAQPAFNVLAGLTELFAGGAPYVAEAGYATFILSFFEAGSDLSKIMAFDIALASSLVRQNYDVLAEAVWSSLTDAVLGQALLGGNLPLTTAVELYAVTEGNAIPLIEMGALGVDDALLFGLVGPAALVGSGLITVQEVWELLRSGVLSEEEAMSTIQLLTDGAAVTMCTAGDSLSLSLVDARAVGKLPGGVFTSHVALGEPIISINLCEVSEELTGELSTIATVRPDYQSDTTFMIYAEGDVGGLGFVEVRIVAEGRVGFQSDRGYPFSYASDFTLPLAGTVKWQGRLYPLEDGELHVHSAECGTTNWADYWVIVSLTGQATLGPAG